MPTEQHPRPAIVLFDIDGTLLDAHGAGRRAMEAGFAAVVGDSTGLTTIQFAGMTDPGIVRAGLRGVTGDNHNKTIAHVITAYLEHLPIELDQSPPRVLPGVHSLLDALAPRPHVAIGVGTGNVEPGARTKLRAAKLDHYFPFGGFGSDHEQRDRLLYAGALRGAQRLNRSLRDCRILVIGDTPRDVAAAHAIGAECMAVATSHFDMGSLRATGASEVVRDLASESAHTWLLQRLP